MEENLEIVKKYYDEGSIEEWNRLEKHPFEFIITVKMMERYIKTGDSILDIGGGPGRYSLYFAKKGCDVTLFDLSDGNIQLANRIANEENLKLKTHVGDARNVDNIIKGEFDHVFLMGPMYHLIDENDRIKAMTSALSKLKKGGKIYVSFILLFAGLIYEMKNCPEFLINKSDEPFIKALLNYESFGGDAFTKAFFIQLKDIEPFLNKFPINKLHLFGQEGILGPCENNIIAQSKEVIDKWLEIAYALCEREELLSYSEHVMYIGEKY